MKKKTFFIFFFLILIFFGVGIQIGKSLVICKVCPPEDLDFSLFWEALDILKKKYILPKEIDYKKILYGAISGMMNSLGDSYTVFLDPEKSKIFLEDVSGKFEGVGMEIGIKEKQLQVIAPLEGTPAQKAGILAGDKIIRIDGESTSGITIEEAVKKIRGPKGTEVILTILREGWEEPKDFRIKRDVIKIPCVNLEKKENDIAYIRIYFFSESLKYEFYKIGREILNSGLKKIILDLRNNPGGYLEIAQNIGGWFLKRGDMVAIEDFGEEKKNKEYRAFGNEAFLNFPVVVIINKGTASASEILASALRENRGVKLIGERSFGKGSIQEISSLSDESALKITVARWLTPKGELIEGKGLEPDIVVELTEEDIKEGRDPQLEKAIEIIKNL